jgi:predicted DNA-binding protein (UPF0251 family)
MKKISDETRRRMSESAKARCNKEWRKKQSEMKATKLPEEKVKLLYQQGCTQKEIGNILGCSQKVVWRFMKNHGIKSRLPANKRLPKFREENPSWKGGKHIHSGYVRLRTPTDSISKGESNGYIREHDYIMEKHIGRALTKDEVVHHINGIKTDNRLENLQLMTRAEHMKLHCILRKRGDAICQKK